jgi:hypothetical protein
MQLNVHNFSSVADAINFASNQIDQAAGDARAKYLTVAQGQDATYTAKYQDACAFRVASYLPTDGTGFPWVMQEAAGLGISAQAAATNILTPGDVWNLTKGPQIEGLRIGGKAALQNLPDIPSVLKSAYSTKTALSNA